MRPFLCLAALLLFLPMGAAQTSSAFETLGTIKASTLSAGLGVNVAGSGFTQEWQFAKIKAMGASHIRIQCGWASVEQQTPPPNNRPASPQYVQLPGCASALTLAHKYGLKVTYVAAFGPPFHKILTVTTTAPVRIGDTSIPVAFASGMGGDTLASLHFPYDYVLAPYGNLGIRHSYQGTLLAGQTLTDPTHATLQLASAVYAPFWQSDVPYTAGSYIYSGGLWVALQANKGVAPGANPSIWQSYKGSFNAALGKQAMPAGATLTINEILYPSTASDNASDPSVNAYSNYANFLAVDMAQRGVQGDIEIWNEPPWQNDSWDDRPALYDIGNSGPWNRTRKYDQSTLVTKEGTPYISLIPNNLGNDPASSPQAWSRKLPSNAYTGQPVYLMNRHFPPGVTATWNGTSGNGTASVMGSMMKTFSGVPLVEPSPTVTLESHHPYGALPEFGLAPANCLKQAARNNSSPYSCLLPHEISPGGSTSNQLLLEFFKDQQQLVNPNYGVGHAITETNYEAFAPAERTVQARFDLRQYLGSMANDYEYVEFFLFWDGNGKGGLNFITAADNNGNDFKPWPAYTAMQGLMTDLAPIAHSPVQPENPNTLATITGYNGTYPLGVVHAVGTRSGASANSEALYLWQRSYCSTGRTCFTTLAPPPPAPASVRIPPGMRVTSIMNLTTRAPITPTATGQQLTIPVTDDPVELILDPATPGRSHRVP